MQQQPSPRIPTHGAVDLSALSGPRQGAGGSAGAGTPAASGFVVDVTETTFQQVVLTTSQQVPVVLDFWADWCEPCKQLSPVLEKLAAEGAGRWLLAKIDVDAHQRLAQTIGVESLPTVMAVVAGQPVPMFSGALPEGQVRQYIEELLRVAAQNNVAGTLATDGGADADADGDAQADTPEERFPEAAEALERGDADAAVTAYTQALDQHPNDPEAVQGLAASRLLARAAGADPGPTRAAAGHAPTDVDAQCLAADVDTLDGDFEAAFNRLVELIRSAAGEDRERARRHLLTLFDVAGPEDPRVITARRALASALF